MVNALPNNQTTLTEAKKVLGTSAKGLSDDAIRQLVTKIEILTDIVITHVNDSKYQTSVDIFDQSSHNDK